MLSRFLCPLYVSEILATCVFCAQFLFPSPAPVARAVFVFAMTAPHNVSRGQRAKLSYLSMMTGSDGVSFLLPQLFLSQHRLQGGERMGWGAKRS